MSQQSSSMKLVLASLAIVLCAACGGGSDNKAGSGSKGEIVMGYSPQAVYLPFIIAVEQGFLADAGVEASLQSFPSGAEQTDAVLTGQADVSGNGQYNLPLVASKGGKIKAVGEYITSGEQFGVVATADIKSPEDLRGKTVGTQLGTSTAYYYDLFAEKFDLGDDVKMKDVKFAQMIPALRSGDVSAYFAFEPLMTAAVASVDGAHVLARSGDEGVFDAHVYLNVSEKIYGDPDLAKAFLTGMSEASKWLAANEEEAADKYWKKVGAKSADEAKQQISQLNYEVNFNDASFEALEAVTKYLEDTGVIETGLDVESMVNRTFANDVFGTEE